MNPIHIFRRAAQFSTLALALGLGLVVVAHARADEPSTQPAKEGTASPDAKVKADAGQGAQFFINGKVVAPEDAGKIPPGARIISLPDGKVLIVNDAKNSDAAPATREAAGKSDKVQAGAASNAGTGTLTISGANIEGQGNIVFSLTANMSDYYVGLECFPADDALRAQLKLPEHQGLIVEQVVPDSPAAKAGLKRFDMLLTANDKKLSEVSDLMAIIEEMKDKEIAIKLLRGGEKQKATVTPAKRPEVKEDALKAVPAPEQKRDEPKFLIQLQPQVQPVLGGEDAKGEKPGDKGTIPPGARVMSLPDGKVLIVNESKGGEAKGAEGSAAIPAEATGKFIINFGDLSVQQSDYFVGVDCLPADAALRAQFNLPEHQGLIIEQVVPDSPAAKAELKRYDVLLTANDKQLGEISDLAAIVDEVKESDIRLKLLRGGKEQTITVKPAKRPKPEELVLPHVPAPDQKAMQESLKFLIKAQGDKGQGEDGKGNMTFRVIGPGVTVPSAGKLTDLPDDMSVTITRKGKNPAQILVQQGDEKWKATDKDLDTLPEKIRGFVGPLVGRYDLMRFRADFPGDAKWNRPATIAIRRADGTGESDLPSREAKKSGGEKRLEGTVEERMEMMQREIEQLREMNSRLPAAIHEALTTMAQAMGRQIEAVREETRAGGDKRAEEFRQREQQIRTEYEQQLRELKKSLNSDDGGNK